MSRDWPIAQDADGYFRAQEKRMMHQERRPAPVSASDLLGPGFSQRAIELIDWNDEVATYNGYFYTLPGALHTPDPEYRWAGVVVAMDDSTGMQLVWQGEPPVEERPPEVPNPEQVPVTEGDPEPVQAEEAPPVNVRSWVRYFSINAEERAAFTDWSPAGSNGGGKLDDLEDVTIFEDMADKSILVWDATFNSGEGQWIPIPFVPGVAGLRLDVDAALAAAEEAIAAQEANIYVFRQPEPPVPGVDDVPDPIKDNSLWFDTDDSSHPWIWDGAAWVEVDAGLLDTVEAAAAAAQADATEALSQAAAAITAAGDAGTAAAAASDAIDAANIEILALQDFDSSIFPILATDISDDAITTPKLAANAITAKHTITGALFQTEETASRGIKLSSGGMSVYNSSGVATMTITASTGAISMLGALTTGSSVTGATVTGGTLQTEVTAARGIKITSTGLVAYNTGGSPVFTVTSGGAVSMLGSLVSGSDISGATITGGLIQTTNSGSQGIKITTSGLAAYTAGGGLAFYLNAVTGQVTINGNLGVAMAIDGATVTGGTLQTSSSANVGIKMTSTGLVAYGGGSPVFTLLSSTGEVTMRGTLTSGSEITGAGIYGSTLSTGSAGQTSTGSAFSPVGERIILRNDGGGGIIEFFTGISGETPGSLDGRVLATDKPGVRLASPATPSYPSAAVINLYAGTSAALSTVSIAAGYMTLTGRMDFNGSADFYGSVTSAQRIQAFGGVTTSASLVVNSGGITTSGGYSFSGGGSVTGGITVNGGLTVASNGASITGSITGSNGLTITSGGINIAGTGSFTSTMSATKFFSTNPTNTGVTGVPNLRFPTSAGGEIVWTSNANSSRRYKKNIERLVLTHEQMYGMVPYLFDRKETPTDRPEGHRFLGFMAEDTHALGKEFEDLIYLDDQGRPDEFDYAKVSVIQAATILDLNERLARLEAMLLT